MKKLKIIQIGIQHEHAAGKMDTLRKMEDIFEVVGFCCPADPGRYPLGDETAFISNIDGFSSGAFADPAERGHRSGKIRE